MATGASFRVSVQGDLQRVVSDFAVRSERLIEAAAARALNRTATSVRAEAVRRIRDVYAMKAAVVRKQLRLTRAGRGKLFADVIASGRRIPLIEFLIGGRLRARGRRALVKVRVKHQGGVKTLQHAFVAAMPTGHVGIYERKGPPRLPIKELYAVSLPQAFSERTVRASLVRVAAERFRIEFAREIKFRSLA